jgi:hypothetical protein
MAYKNKKKQKTHIKRLRLIHGTISRKHAREKERNNPLAGLKKLFQLKYDD